MKLRALLSFTSWRRSRKTLFVRMLTWFLSVIALLLSFNMLTYTFFRSTIHDEIIQNNSLNLQSAVNLYESHFTRIQTIGIGMLLDERLRSVIKTKDGSINYESASMIRNDFILSTIRDPMLFIDNIMLYLRDHAFIVDKSGTSGAEDMFGRYYHHPDYEFTFWQGELEGNHHFRIYPSASFQYIVFGSSSDSEKTVPILVQNVYAKQMSLLFFLDQEKLIDAYVQRSGEDSFYLFDGNGTELISSGDMDTELAIGQLLVQEPGHIDYRKIGDDYYFFTRGSDTGLTYVSAVPTTKIAAQLTKLNVILVLILTLALLLGVAAAVYFARRLYTPVSRILAAMEGQAASPGTSTQIREFDLISDRLTRLSQDNRTMDRDLQRKNSLLQQYLLTSRLKRLYIHSEEADRHFSVESDKPYWFVGVRLLFKGTEDEAGTGIRQDRAAKVVQELLQAYFRTLFKDATTLQVESNLLVSFLPEAERVSPETMEEHLQELTEVFDLDHAYYLATIAARHNDAGTAPAESYQHILHLLDSRKLSDTTQMIMGDSEDTEMIAEDEGSAFYTHLEQGNESELLRLVFRKLAGMEKRGASQKQVAEFARGIVYRTASSLHPEDVLRVQPAPPLEAIKACYTLSQFEDFFRAFLPSALALMKERREVCDPVVQYILDYVDEHYGEGVSLDLLADKLKMSRTYLSSYFKEKHGKTFSEHLNDVRMNKAVELLSSSDLMISEVAERVGYYSVNSFIRNFKKVKGIPPGEYRRSLL